MKEAKLSAVKEFKRQSGKSKRGFVSFKSDRAASMHDCLPVIMESACFKGLPRAELKDHIVTMRDCLAAIMESPVFEGLSRAALEQSISEVLLENIRKEDSYRFMASFGLPFRLNGHYFYPTRGAKHISRPSTRQRRTSRRGKSRLLPRFLQQGSDS